MRVKLPCWSQYDTTLGGKRRAFLAAAHPLSLPTALSLLRVHGPERTHEGLLTDENLFQPAQLVKKKTAPGGHSSSAFYSAAMGQHNQVLSFSCTNRAWSNRSWTSRLGTLRKPTPGKLSVSIWLSATTPVYRRRPQTIISAFSAKTPSPPAPNSTIRMSRDNCGAGTVIFFSPCKNMIITAPDAKGDEWRLSADENSISRIWRSNK